MKQLKVGDEVFIYRDGERTARAATARESSASIVASLIGYEVFDAAETRLGSPAPSAA